ncbi:MAG: succinyldiaminopimelate transaminase [Pseudomonadota bacterium]
MNPSLELLKPYPFERLDELLTQIHPPSTLHPISLSMGEPNYSASEFITQKLKENIDLIQYYPCIKGIPELRLTIAQWIINRYKLEPASIDPDSHILPINGTREAIFALAQAVVDPTRSDPLVIMSNPFYQVYEGATIIANATPVFLAITSDNNFLPDFSRVPDEYWRNCQLVYICTPGNPTGNVYNKHKFYELMTLSMKYDFVIASDECYSEIYHDESKPPIGLLEMAADFGNNEYKNCIIFNSLSKRSNVPGLRSGFIAGDKKIIQAFLKYRTYHGCSMPLPTQYASIECWKDEQHVIENRNDYRKKFKEVLEILSPVLEVKQPEATFYLWLKTPYKDDEKFSQDLYRLQNITVLPGSYLSRVTGSKNPGQGYVRIALVACLEDCIEAAIRIRAFVQSM